MSTTRKQRKVLIAALALFAILFLLWSSFSSPMQLIHAVKLGMSRDEVVAIMGKPEHKNRVAFYYGWSFGHAVNTAIPGYKLSGLDHRYPVIIAFDQDDRAIRIYCPSEGIDLGLVPPPE